MTLVYRKYILVSLIVMLTALPIAVAYDKEFLEKLTETVAKTYGKEAVARFQKWCELIETSVDKKPSKQLILVNDFINGAERVSDAELYGQEDYWATPMEMLGSYKGDCEDLSIAKFFTLSMMGVPMDKLRISYVTAIEHHEAHIVLSYYETPGAEPLILDTLKPEIMPASKRPDLKPIYGFNSEFIWVTKKRGRKVKVGMTDRFKQWNTLVTKMKQEVGHK